MNAVERSQAAGSGKGLLVGRAAKCEAGDNQHEECGSLERGGDQLRGTSPFDAPPLQDCEAQQDNDGDGCVFAGERRKKHAGVIADDERDDGVGTARGDPVAPAHDEAGILAERATRVIVLATAAGNRGSEFGERGSAEERVKTTDNPDAEKKPYIRQL